MVNAISNESDDAMKLLGNHSESQEPPPPGPPVDSDRRSGDDGGMEARLSKLESLFEQALERISAIELDIAVIRSNYATREDISKMREDLAKLEATLIKWFIATAVTIVSLAFAAAKFIH